MHKMKQTNELQASLDFASRSEEAENYCKGCTRPQILISRGHVWGPMAENSLYGYQTCKKFCRESGSSAPDWGKCEGPAPAPPEGHHGQGWPGHWQILPGLPWALPESAPAPEC